MPDQALLATLKDIGLTDHEAQVYLANLALGPSTVAKIAQEAEIKRTTAYYVIGSLQQQGLMNIEIKGFKQLFVAENPEKLESVLETRKRAFKKVLPEFSALYNLHGSESTIRYYQGLEAIKHVYENLLADVRPHDSYLVISETERWGSLDQKFFQHFRERRAKLRLDLRLLVQDNASGREFKKFGQNYGEDVRLLPPMTTLTTNLVITPHRVVLHQLTPPIMAIVIENLSVVQLHQETFEMLWNALPESASQKLKTPS